MRARDFLFPNIYVLVSNALIASQYSWNLDTQYIKRGTEIFEDKKSNAWRHHYFV